MGHPVFLQQDYASRFGLLGAMAEELGRAFQDSGWVVNPDETVGDRAGLVVWFNSPPNIDAVPEGARVPGSRVAMVQYFVDHPFAISESIMDELAAMPNYRLLLPSVDGLHLLRLRWPTLRHGHMLHAVPRPALCDDINHDRPADVVAMGSVHTEQEIAELRQRLPAALHVPSDEMVGLLVAQPWMPFEQALDLVLGSRGMMTGQWTMAAAIWRAVTAAVNRHRRFAVLGALQGLAVDVWGVPAIAEGCGGTVRYRGEFAYGESSAIMRTAKVCLAWGPTQFAHSFSERVLLAMAAGCAAVSDDRLLLRARLGDAVERYDGAHPASARLVIESLLADDARRRSLAEKGRALVEREHLWTNRLEMFGAVGSEAIAV